MTVQQGTRWRVWTAATVALLVMSAASAMAQTSGAPASAGVVAAASTDEPDPDLPLVAGEPDFTLGVLPTTLRLPKGKAAFRLTHRFTYQINGGSFGEFVENGFGFDSSAATGFEVRVGVAAGTQFVVHRTGGRNVQFLGQHQFVTQRSGAAVSVDLVTAVEGLNNFREHYSLAVGGVISRRFGDRGAVYVEPIGVFNVLPSAAVDTRDTLVLGLGVRLRIARSRAYVVAEVAPRVAGYNGEASVMTFGLEKRAGGHVFQLNLSNGFGTTLAQVGRGGPRVGLNERHWHLGFNLTRKFY